MVIGKMWLEENVSGYRCCVDALGTLLHEPQRLIDFTFGLNGPLHLPHGTDAMRTLSPMPRCPSSSLRSYQAVRAAAQLVEATSSWTRREISSLNAADWSFASWYLLMTVFTALPNRPEDEIGVSRRKALSFSFIHVRLIHRCHSRSQNITFLRGMQNRKCKSNDLNSSSHLIFFSITMAFFGVSYSSLPKCQNVK